MAGNKKKNDGFLKIPKYEEGKLLTGDQLILLGLFRERARQAKSDTFTFPFSMFKRFAPPRLAMSKSKSAFFRGIDSLREKGCIEIINSAQGKPTTYRLLDLLECPSCGYKLPEETLENCPSCGWK